MTRTKSILAATLTAVLAGTLADVPALAAAEVQPSEPATMAPVPGRGVPVRPASPDPAAQAAARPVPQPAALVDALSVSLAGSAAASMTTEVDGLAVTVGGGAGLARNQRATMTVDYSAVRNLYGGDWAARLRLVDRSTGDPLPAGNDLAAGLLTAAVQPGSTYDLTAEEEGGTGDYSATTLSPAGSWQVNLQGGGFSWSYDVRTPPVPGGLVPDLSLSYSSAAVDGRTASTNNQPSWIGEGWGLWPGSIERSYRTCADDPGKPRTGDLCWVTENATLSLGGQSTPLVREGTSRRWRPEVDDGTRVQQVFDAANGDVRGERWVVTTTDGVQFHFGSQPAAESTWTVPVFGDSPGDGCGGAFEDSWCNRAYRWNLDYVVDPHGNTMTYQYRTETNRYARNLTDTAVSTYTRGGYLERVDYGTRAGGTGPAQARVVFAVADRCRPGATCSQHTGAAWPDVPWDRECTGTSCADKHSPTFWSTKRLASITTQIRSGSTYANVDRWTLDQIYPDPGDGTSAGLWLHGLTHTGLVGGSQPMPAVTFGGTAKANRVNSAADGLPHMNKYRVNTIHNGSGGDTNVVYAPANCSPNTLPAPATNPLRCFPVRWVPAGEFEPRDDWFHTYVVSQVSLDDRVAGGMLEVNNYEYAGGAAWRYNDDPVIPEKYRTWSLWRGYETVRVRHGNPALEPERPQSLTQYRYFRGMHGDRTAAGGSKSVSVTDSTGKAWTDHEPLAGVLREEITYNGAGGPEVTGTINDPWTRGPTATQGPLSAHQVEVGRTVTRTALSAGGFRRTQLDTTYDEWGNPSQVNDLGDQSTAADDRCTSISYARNLASWLVSLTSQARTVGVACGATPRYPDDAITDVRNYYDGLALGAAPGAGDLTKAESAASYTGSTPNYAVTAETTYDGYGRVLDTYDALRRRTSTRYAPATGLLATTTVTNPLGHTVTHTHAPAWGEQTSTVDANGLRTDLAYDPLGRLTSVWLPGQPKALGLGPNLRYAYGVRGNAPSWVRTETLAANGNYVSSFTLFDGFMRQRQVQAPSPAGGRILTDTVYDSRGLTHLTRGPYYDGAAPGTGLFQPDINQVPGMTLSYFDGAEREVTSIYMSFNQEQWRTSTSYHGDHVAVTPPRGGTATATYTDARGRTTQLRQYRGPTPTGAHDATGYSHTKAGHLSQVVDAAGNTWRYEYDVLGRRLRAVDPDHGARTMTYDAAGQLLTTTDARARAVAYTYDTLGRQTAIRQGSATGPLLAQWVYDTVSKGKLTSSTRYQDGRAYTRAVVGYDVAGRPTGESVIIPAGEAGVAGVYTTTTTYKVDGSPSVVRLPALGNLAAETLSHSYDALGKLLSVKSTVTGYLNQVIYTELGELSQVEHVDRLDLPAEQQRRVWQTRYYQDGTRRLSEVLTEREQPGNMLVDRLNYGYDPTGNLTSISDQQPGVAQDTQCFHYDHLRRMTEAWTQAGACAAAPGTGVVGGPAPYWHSYRYDVTGNRTEQVRHGLGGAADTVSTYAYPQPGTARPHAVSSVQTTGAGTAEYSYDAAGNTTGRPGPAGSQQLIWGDEGQLQSVTAGGGTTSYVYDADGAQLIRRDPGSVTLFITGSELTVHTGTGAKQGTRYYSAGDVPLAMRTGTGVRWLVADHHGTSQVAVDPATLQATVRRFDPFGNPRGPAATWPGGQRGFVGGTDNETTGLTRLGAREYDPQLGRFVSVDPIVDPNDPQQMNPYGYAGNNPATMSDPDGLYYTEDLEGRKRVQGAGSSQRKKTGGGGGGSASSGNRGCPPDRDCRSGGEKAAQALLGKLYQPVMGRRWAEKKVPELKTWYGYQGSDLFTYADALEFATLGRSQFLIVCETMGISQGSCARNTGGGVEFIAEITGINDVVDCFGGDAVACLEAANPVSRVAKVPKAVAAASDKAEDAVPEGSENLYRGVPNDHPAYPDASTGTARPRGGHDNPTRHNVDNDTQSVFTSWTTDFDVAVLFLKEKPGVILRIPNADKPGHYIRVESPDMYDELEVLIRGVVEGAEVIPHDGQW